MPFVVLGELRAGFVCGTRSAQNIQTLTRFLNKPRVQVLFPNDGTTHHYANLYANLFRQLRKQGTPIPTNDIWIAALCVQHDLFLSTNDAHFDHLPQIPYREKSVLAPNSPRSTRHNDPPSYPYCRAHKSDICLT